MCAILIVTPGARQTGRLAIAERLRALLGYGAGHRRHALALEQRGGRKAGGLEHFPLVQRLAREQCFDERVELLAMTREQRPRLLVALLDDPEDLRIDA